MIITESIRDGKTIDILKPLEYCRYIPIFGKSTDNISDEILGEWRIIPRLMYIMRPYPDNNPLGSNISDFIRIDFRSDGIAYFLVDWPKNKTANWKISKNAYDSILECQVEYYSNNNILFYDGDILFTDEYILLRELSITKYVTIQNLLGYLSKLQISAYFYIHDKRNAILKNAGGSKNKANEYILSHQDDLICRLCPRFKTFKTTLIDWIDYIF